MLNGMCQVIRRPEYFPPTAVWLFGWRANHVAIYFPAKGLSHTSGHVRFLRCHLILLK